MALQKCNYLVFTNSNLYVSDELNIKLNGTKLKYGNVEPFQYYNKLPKWVGNLPNINKIS